MADPVIIAIIGAIGSVAAATLAVVAVIISTHTKRAVVTLEKNTNSIKDALVHVTGQEAFARGVKQGTETTAGIAAAIVTKQQGIL